MGRFDGKVALITGSGRGTGLVDAELMAREGARIVIHDIDPKLAAAGTETVRAAGADIKAMQAKIAEAEAHFGRIDILVNNAGNAVGGTLETIDEAAYDAVMNVHVKGSFYATQAVVLGMKRRKEGAIVNISSIWGMTVQSVSQASKCDSTLSVCST